MVTKSHIQSTEEATEEMLDYIISKGSKQLHKNASFGWFGILNLYAWIYAQHAEPVQALVDDE